MNISHDAATPITKQQTHTLSPNAAQATKTHTAPIAKAALSSPDISAASREKLASYVEFQQQQSLIKTAQKAFTPTEEETIPTQPTGEIAKEAAKKQTKQALAFIAIDAISEKVSDRPQVQTQA